MSLGIGMPGSFRLESPNTFSGQKGRRTAVFPMKTECFEEERVVKAVDMLDV